MFEKYVKDRSPVSTAELLLAYRVSEEYVGDGVICATTSLEARPPGVVETADRMLSEYEGRMKDAVAVFNGLSVSSAVLMGGKEELAVSGSRTSMLAVPEPNSKTSVLDILEPTSTLNIPEPDSCVSPLAIPEPDSCVSALAIPEPGSPKHII